MWDGYIKLWRSMVEWEWYKSPIVKSVFIHLLILANHKDTRWQGVDLKKGQFATSVESIHQATGCTTQQIRTALTKLKSTNEITIKTTNQFTLITIENWESYQNIPPESTNDSATDSTNEQQTDNKRITTDKNDKNDKNDKKIIYGEFQLVKLTSNQFQKLNDKFGEKGTNERIVNLELYLAKTGKKYADHYATILTWERKTEQQKPVDKEGYYGKYKILG